jgi:excisionase family DNA binding protein
MHKNAITVNLTIPEEKIQQIIEAVVSKHLSGNTEKQSVPSILTVKQLSNYLGLAEVTIYKKVSESVIPFFKVGRRVLFKKDVIDSWFSKHRNLTCDEFNNEVENKKNRKL